jgi:tellurite resistance protein
VLPGYVRAPAYVTEPWIALGVLFFIVLVPLYVVKLARYPHAVREEFTNPMQLGFCGALPVGMFLVGGGLAPYWFALGDAIWWIGFALLLPFQIWALTRWLSGSIDLAHINAGWLIVMVGGIVAPGPGIALDHPEASRFIFGISAAAAPILMALLFYRAIIGAPLPDRFRPTWFILLVPPSLIYANGLALYPGSDFLEPLFFFGLALALALLLVSRSFPRWPYGPAWWAFTFPLDALAYAATRYAEEHPAADVGALDEQAQRLAALAAENAAWTRGLTIGNDRTDIRRLLEHALHDSTHHLLAVKRGLARIRADGA